MLKGEMRKICWKPPEGTLPVISTRHPEIILFTAGGSEADNWILRNAVTTLQVKRIVTSPIEHHAVIHTLEALKQEFGIEVMYVRLTDDGSIDYTYLRNILEDTSVKTLVSLMHVNNETGKILDLKKVSDMCRAKNVLFHSDTVQGVGHFRIDLQAIPVDFITASAHKFHGPKGVGFAYFREVDAIHAMLLGGGQERGLRAGTENIHNINGMEKALQIAYDYLDADKKYIQQLKSYFINALLDISPDIRFNAESDNQNTSSYVILNVRFPKEIPMFLFHLDLKGVAASGGSACQSGAEKGSHVLQAILDEEDARKTSVRFSFSKLNTFAELDYVIGVIRDLMRR